VALASPDPVSARLIAGATMAGPAGLGPDVVLDSFGQLVRSGPILNIPLAEVLQATCVPVTATPGAASRQRMTGDQGSRATQQKLRIPQRPIPSSGMTRGAELGHLLPECEQGKVKVVVSLNSSGCCRGD
jgi:hypothetical protein